MTRLDVSIDRLILHGVSAEMGHEVGELVRERLASLAAGGDGVRRGREPQSEPQRIAEVVAHDLWGRITAAREGAR